MSGNPGGGAFLPLRFPRPGKKIYQILFSLFIFLLAVLPAHGQKTAIKDLVITNSKQDLLVFFTLQDAFSKEMEEAVRNGIPVTFTFTLEVKEVREGWMDSELASVSFDHILSYDSLKDEYYVQKGESNGRKVVFDHLNEAIKVMCEINGYRLLPVNQLHSDKDYMLRVRASLVKKELPFKLHYLIPFYSLWGFTTDWVTLPFRY